MSMFDKIKGKAEEVVEEHGDKIRGGMDKAGEFVDEKTGGKYRDKIDKGLGAAKGQLNRLDRGNRPETPEDGPGSPSGGADGQPGPDGPGRG